MIVNSAGAAAVHNHVTASVTFGNVRNKHLVIVELSFVSLGLMQEKNSLVV